MLDSSIPPEGKGNAFLRWCCTYSTPVPDGVPITTQLVQERDILERTPTLLTLSAEDFEDVTEVSSVLRSGAIVFTSREIHEMNARRTFLDADSVLPNVGIVALWCDQGPWLCVWAVKLLQDILEEEPADGKRKRPVSLFKIHDANHFVRLSKARLSMLRLMGVVASIIGMNPRT